jgi:PAS domain S-box-containing protein
MKHCPLCARAYPGAERFCSVHGLPLVEGQIAVGERPGECSGLILDNRYRLAGVVGKGGMGVVYEAENLRIGRRCAVKLLHQGLVADPKMRMRLFREVQAASRVRHRNIVEIWDYGEHERAGSYLVMEFVDGKSLSHLIARQSPMSVRDVCRVGVQLCAALAATHAHGLVHRDLKPGNVILTPEGVAKVLDFGLVKPFRPEADDGFVSVTTEGVVFGTPQYLAPEQVLDLPADPRADVYSLGVILYEMLVGRLPFTGNTAIELVEGHQRKPVPLPSAVNPKVQLPAKAEVLLLRALSKEPADRHPSMHALMDDLYALARDQGIPLEQVDGPPAGAAPAPALDLADGPPVDPVEDTTPMAMPAVTPVAPSTPLGQVRERALERFEDLLERAVAALRATFPHYRSYEPGAVREQVGLVLRSAIESIGREPSTELPPELRRRISARTVQDFPLSEVLGAVWLGYITCRPLALETAKDDIASYVALEEQLDRGVLPFILGLVDAYVAWAQGRLVSLNEILSCRNEELQQLRTALAEEVRRTTSRLSEVERLKASVTESISSGLILVERSSWRILLYNKAMERMTGLPAGLVVGKSFDEIMHHVDGLPVDEFAEQVRLHGEVGRRKLRLRFASGEQRTVYLRGEPFSAGETGGTLYVIDDVSERERIIENLGRYVSRDVVDRIIAGPGELSPVGKASVAAILALRLHDFRAKDHPLEQVVTLLNDYVRDIADSVFHHGGVIERIGTEAALIYFGKLRDSYQPAVAAALELSARFRSTAERRAAANEPRLRVGLGLHVGEVLVLEVGGERLMVRTVSGPATQVAEALAQAAGEGEILMSDGLRTSVGEEATLRPGPDVRLAPNAAPIASLRLGARRP